MPQTLPIPQWMYSRWREYKDLVKGSFDTEDPLTTNLCVGNINPKVGGR